MGTVRQGSDEVMYVKGLEQCPAHRESQALNNYLINFCSHNQRLVFYFIIITYFKKKMMEGRLGGSVM